MDQQVCDGCADKVHLYKIAVKNAEYSCDHKYCVNCIIDIRQNSEDCPECPLCYTKDPLECVMCMQLSKRIHKTRCNHILCQPCWKSYINVELGTEVFCPECRENLFTHDKAVINYDSKKILEELMSNLHI
jgi:hypothetical protein